MKISLLANLILLIFIFAVNDTAAGEEKVTLCRPEGASIIENGYDTYNTETMRSREKVKTIEQRLAELGYNPGKVDGKTDSHFECAVMAFQKMNGLERNGQIDIQFIDALKNPLQPGASQKHEGIHAEADLQRQIMTVYLDDRILRILPISSGSDRTFKEAGEGVQIAETPTGNFTFFAHIWGVHESHLGELFNPVYFDKGGYAVHGELFVPPYGASHGCLRITIEDSEWFEKTVPIGSHLLVSETALPASRH